MIRQPTIKYADGTPVTLTTEEQYLAERLQREFRDKFKNSLPSLKNSLGYEISITTLTQLSKKITMQKFFEVAPADYLPVRVGEGTWASNIVTYRQFDIADEFETGVINVGGQNARLATADTGIDSLTIQVLNWGKSIGWTIFELEQAARSGNWDIVTAKEKARKRNWDLGVQRVAFLGARGLNGASGQCLGLLNQAGITTNTTLITGYINQLSPSDLKTFCAKIIEAYRDNVARTAWPTHFIVPESEYNGLASQASADFPIKSVLQVLEETFQLITQKKDFKILPLSYADPKYHADVSSILNKHVYTLLNYDEESLRMDIPLDYTNTLANSLDNFAFQNVGYGQFTGVLAYRPLEMMYFTW